MIHKKRGCLTTKTSASRIAYSGNSSDRDPNEKEAAFTYDTVSFFCQSARFISISLLLIQRKSKL